MDINIETLRKTKGIGQKTLERIIEQHYIDSKNKVFKSEYIPSNTYKIDKDINLWHGDCLELMNHIPDKSVDMILADLPYGTTACSWDEVIPFEPLWSHYKRIIKDNGAVVLFGSEPFSTRLRMSNLYWYKYDWVWKKNKCGNFAIAKYQPLKYIENIMVFSSGRHQYYPIMRDAPQATRKRRNYSFEGSKNLGRLKHMASGEYKHYFKYGKDKIYPTNIIKENNVRNNIHPTQKPVPLLEYLIKTYTKENMLVLDNVMGSGSTGVACKNLNRRFVGIELEKKYFDIAKERIDENIKQ